MSRITLTTISDHAKQRLVEVWLNDGTGEGKAHAVLTSLVATNRDSTSDELAHALMALTTNDDPIIERINTALQRLGSEKGPKFLLQALLAESSESQVAHRIVGSLLLLKSKAAFDGLERLLVIRAGGDETARSRAALYLMRLNPDDLAKRLQTAHVDQYAWSPWIRMMAIRVLVAAGQVTGDMLTDLIGSPDLPTRFAACKALRPSRDFAGEAAYPATAEGQLVLALKARLTETEECPEVQCQAALALGEMELRGVSHKSEAIAGLTDALEKNADYAVRRCCTEALMSFDGSAVQQALLDAVKDARNTDEDLRTRATAGLRKSIGTDGALNLVIEEILKEATASPALIEALVQLDRDAASGLLQAKVRDPKSKGRDRAAAALARLERDSSVRSDQQRRLGEIAFDSTTLVDAAKKVIEGYESGVRTAKIGLWVGLLLYVLLCALAVCCVAFGLSEAIHDSVVFRRYVGLGTSVAGLGGLLFLLFFNPVRTSRASGSMLVKAGLQTMGQLHRLSREDALYRSAVLHNDLDLTKAIELARAMQASFQDSIDS